MVAKLLKFFDVFKKKTILVKIMTYYIIIFTCVVCIITFIFTERIQRSSKVQADEYAGQVINQSYNVANTVLTSTYSYFYNLCNDDSVVFNALYGNTFNQFEKIDIINKIILSVQQNQLVHSMYVYNLSANLVFSNLDVPMPIDQFYDTEIIKLIGNEDVLKQGTFIPRHLNAKLKSGKVIDENYITIILNRTMKDRYPDAAVVVNIRQKSFSRMINNDKSDISKQAFIIDKHGTIISHPDNEMFNKSIASENYVKKILNAKSPNGYFEDNISGEVSQVYYIKSDSLGWYFVSINPYSQLMLKTFELRNSLIALSVIMLCLGLLTVVLSSLKIYTPIGKLIGEIRRYNYSRYIDRDVNEYQYLTNTFISLNDHVSKLEQSVKQYIPIKKKELLRNILYGKISNEEQCLDDIKALGVQFDADTYIAVVFKIDSFRYLSAKYTFTEVENIKKHMLESVMQLLKKRYKCEGVEEDEDRFTVIMNLKNKDECSCDKLNEVFSGIKDSIMAQYGNSVTVSIGYTVDNIMEIQDSYAAALSAADYRLIYGKNSIINYKDVIEKERDSYQYPLEIERQIINSINLENLDSIINKTDNFFDFIKKFEYNEIILSVTQLVLMVSNTLRGADGHNRESLRLDYKTIYQELCEYDTLDEIKEWVIRIFSDIINDKKVQTDGKKEKTVNKLIQYIEEHISDPNLSADMLAYLVGLSPDYVRRIFKKMTNESLPNYINEMRLKAAAELLLNTDEPAKDIAKKVGFYNSGYFYTLFKRYLGKTPDEFRKSQA